MVQENIGVAPQNNPVPPVVTPPMVPHPAPAPVGIRSELTFTIRGSGSQFIELTLHPGQTITGEISALMYYEAGISMKMRMSSSVDANTTTGGGLMARLLGIGKTVMAGHKLFLMSFNNASQKDLKVAFSMPYPGCIVPVDMAAAGGRLFCQDNAFLCATNDLVMSTAIPRELGANYMNSNTAMQKIEGKGTLFLFSGGSILEKNVVQNEPLNVTTGTTLALQPGVSLKSKMVTKVGLTGQGHMLTEIGGMGHVWLQSLPYSRTKDHLIGHVGAFFGITKKKDKSRWKK